MRKFVLIRAIWHDIYVLFIAGSKQHLAASFHAWSNASCPDEVKAGTPLQILRLWARVEARRAAINPEQVPTSPASLEASLSCTQRFQGVQR